MSTTAVLVGVDGSAGADHALDWAAAEAASRRAPLTLCFVRPGGDLSVPAISRYQAVEVLDAAELRLAGEWPQLAVRRVVAEGYPSTQLRRLSTACGLVVVGARGTSGLRGMPIGSVAGFLVAHAFCPVVIVPAGRADPDAPVVVGADGSPLNDPALEFAFEAAERGEVPLAALSSVDDEPRTAELAWDAVRSWSGKFPRVPVEHRIVDGPPAAELVTASAAASLLVVGSSGHGGRSGLLLGSVSQPVSQQARCPVAVVHPLIRR